MQVPEFGPGSAASSTTAGADSAQFPNIPSSLGFTVHVIEEKKGLAPLDGVDRTALLKDLLKKDNSVNLFCARE